MADKLSVKFNHKAPPKEVKTESDIKVGVRKKTDGSTIHVRAGKILSRHYADGSRDSHGAERKLNELKQAAVEACVRRTEDARVAKMRIRPEGITIHAKPGM
jgi:hypothetical protein